MFEDPLETVLEKAIRGRSATIELSRYDLNDSFQLAALAEQLGLHHPGLVKLMKEDSPQVDLPGGVMRVESNITHDWTTNAYVVFDEDTKEAVVFDTGMDASKIVHELQERSLALKRIYLTHTHADHVQGLKELKDPYPEATVWVHAEELSEGKQVLEGGHVLSWGRWALSVRETPGHSAGGVTYVIKSETESLAVVGDALFAGSMGKVEPIAYAKSIEVIREEILSLEARTVLLPGHGVPSTVGWERAFNAILALPEVE